MPTNETGSYGLLKVLFLLCVCAGISPAPAEGPTINVGFIGCSFVRGNSSDFLLVSYVADKSSAADAGLRKDDVVESIDGFSTLKMAPIDARHALEGPIGGEVKLGINRAGVGRQQLSIVRRSLLETYLPAINEGDVRAETNLGYFYERGPASVLDPVRAEYWYRKAAEQGDAIGERSLGVLYYYGTGVKQSDRDAFAWLYAAAMQEDPRAEYYLGLLYQDGRGTGRSKRQAYEWYDRSARQGIANAQWNLAFAYEKGLGVPVNTTEALTWYRKAEAGLPDNEKLKEHIALLSMRAFVENPQSVSLDPALVRTIFGRYLMPVFYLLITLYLVGGLSLFYFGFKAPEEPCGLTVAIGWLVFQVEGQAVALLLLLLQGAALTAGSLFVTTCLFSAVPVIVSTLGLNRYRIWKASSASWKTLFLYGIGSYVANFMLLVSYDKIYSLVAHSTLPGQPTEVLISKAKHGSVWMAYACIAFALPLTEEILFRGYLFEALKKRLPDAAVVILTAFGFSLVHFQDLYFVPLFGFGLVQGWVRLKTGSLRLPVLLHILNNGLFIAFAS
jgi:membrane protease YdiL (CAAX protease family)